MITQPALPLAVLEFASWSMLGWLAAAALPWLIHRWQWRRHQTTPWAAVELLLSAMQRRSPRIKMQQWLLLAVRTAILVLVALAVAEPSYRRLAIGASGQAPLHRIVVVDQSYSMGCQQADGTRWQHALAAARQSIESSEGDALTLIGWSQRSENVLGKPFYDRSLVSAALEDLQLTQTTADLDSVLRTITAAMDRAEQEYSHLGNHQVVFYTDLGRQTWRVNAQIESLMESVSQRANVTLVNVAEGRHENLAISALSIEPELTLQHHDAQITATLASFGAQTVDKVELELRVNGRPVNRQQVQLNDSSETKVQFTHRFVDAGESTLQVAITDYEDCLPMDDQRWFVADVRPRLRVACFTGEPGAASDIARSLAPQPTGEDNAIRAEIYALSRLAYADLSDYAAVMLCSVDELSTREANLLEQYVKSGGGLAVFLGRTDGATPLLMQQLELPVRVDGIQSPGEYRFDPLEYRHPIVAPFRGQTQAGLVGVAISQYSRLQLEPGRDSAQIVLQFDTSDPALVVDRLGLGRVAVSALPCSLQVHTEQGTPWSSFALSPSFLPVVRELLNYLVAEGRSEQRNRKVGEPLVVPTVRLNANATLRLPGGQLQDLSPSSRQQDQLVFTSTDRVGIYQLNGDNRSPIRYSINLDTRESDLSSIDPEALPAGFLSNSVQGRAVLATANGDVPLMRGLLLAALVLLLLEVGLSWVLGWGWG